MSIAINGFLMGLSLIVAIGPQNALIIRQGLRRVGVTAVILVCLISDVFLIFGGTLGVGVLVERAPILLTALKWVGVAYLLYFAYTCFRDARSPQSPGIASNDETMRDDTPATETLSNGTGSIALAQRTTTVASPQRTWVKPTLTALAITWLNPAAYLDALVMLGSLANQHGESGRWLFALGAFAASAVWFPSIGYGAVKLSTPLSSPRVWQVLNVVIGLIMVGMALRLLMH